MTESKQLRIVALTGAGVSAESGIKTFRDGGGLWEDHEINDVATPEGFSRNPKLVWTFYRERYLSANQAQPNSGHFALARLEEALGERFHLITQNVDGLHQRAGNRNVLEMHGSLHSCFCTRCTQHFPMELAIAQLPLPHCPDCAGILRPDIVWFGEVPYHLEKIDELLQNCALLLVIGTSGSVYPAAGFVMTSKYLGAKTVGLNLERPMNSSFFDEFIRGKTGETLPTYVDQLIHQYT